MNTYPALYGKFGTTKYFVVTMPVSELVNSIQFPSDLQDWEDRSLEGQFQRKLDHARIRRHIAPYFAVDDKRFSSSLVLAARDISVMDFETIHDTSKKLLSPFKHVADNMGFLTIRPQKLIPLDGQHRAKAFQNVIAENKDSKLGEDIISVIIIPFEQSHARYIFNKINKYAKPTSKAGKLITDDDDSLAVATRWLISEGVIPRRLVNAESVSLNEKSREFTLLSTFYDSNKTLLSVLSVPKVGRADKMDEKERIKVQNDLKKEWQKLFSGIDEWKKALEDPSEKGDQTRTCLRKNSILGKPIGQLSLIKGYTYAYTKLQNKDMIIKRLNRINWNIDNPMWTGLLVKPNGRMMYGTRVANMASNMIGHLVGAKLSRIIENNLLDYIHGTTRKKSKRLPMPVKKT